MEALAVQPSQPPSEIYVCPFCNTRERVTTFYAPLLRSMLGTNHTAHAHCTTSFRRCLNIRHLHQAGQAVLLTRGTQTDQIDPSNMYPCSHRTTRPLDMVLWKQMQIQKMGMRIGHCYNLLPRPLYDLYRARQKKV